MTASTLRRHPSSVRLSPEELADLLSAVESSYESAVFYSDLGRVDFSTFAGLARALRLLRRLRDELKAAA